MQRRGVHSGAAAAILDVDSVNALLRNGLASGRSRATDTLIVKREWRSCGDQLTRYSSTALREYSCEQLTPPRSHRHGA